MNNDLGAEDTLSVRTRRDMYYTIRLRGLQRILVNGSTLQPSALLWSWSMQPMTISKNRDGNLNRGILKEAITNMMIMLAPFLPIASELGTC